eukprot:5756739-Pyramimonas_sp.AAC.1
MPEVGRSPPSGTPPRTPRRRPRRRLLGVLNGQYLEAVETSEKALGRDIGEKLAAARGKKMEGVLKVTTSFDVLTQGSEK